MPRTSLQDITDNVHSWLLGAFCAYTTWSWLNRKVYSSSRLSRTNLVVCLLVLLRLVSSIRLESADPGACYFWILCRSTISLFGIFGLNIYFVTELWLKLSVGIGTLTQGQRKHWRYLSHGGTQAINLGNMIQYLTVMSAFTNRSSFCALNESNVVPLTVLTLLSFTISLGMSFRLATTKSVFMSFSPDIARLFRVLTWSTMLLCVWVVFIHVDSLLLEWQDWKSMYFTVMLVWMTVNSLVASNYLIHLRVKTGSQVKQVSGGSSSGAAASQHASGKDRPRAGSTTASGSQSTRVVTLPPAENADAGPTQAGSTQWYIMQQVGQHRTAVG